MILLAHLLFSVAMAPASTAPASDPNVLYSPYNWYVSPAYAQSANPGAYFKVGFTGREIAVKIDVSPLVAEKVPALHYPLVRYSVDGGPATTVQIQPDTVSIPCGTHLREGAHSLLFQYVSGYVFLDFWSPVNVVRITGFALNPGGELVKPVAPLTPQPRRALFLGDSITNGDDDVATFKGGITNEVDTQDATVGYPSVVAAGLGAEYGVVAYGGASWDHTAADGHTPGLMDFFSKLDREHSRFVDGKLTPTPDDIFINIGENSPPSGDDVRNLLIALRAAAGPSANIFVIVPFSGRSRQSLSTGTLAFAKHDSRTHLLDVGKCPYLTDAGPTMLSVDGQHPLATLQGLLGAQILEARDRLLKGDAPK